MAWAMRPMMCRGAAAGPPGAGTRWARLWLVAAVTALGACVILAAVAEGQACQPRIGASGKECFVSLDGSDTNPGTIKKPFRTIMYGLRIVRPGDVLTLRGGVYVEPLRILGKRATASKPLVVRSYVGEEAIIDGTLTDFRMLDNNDWVPARDQYPNARADEYVSKMTIEGYVRGAFLDREPYTRLITYSRIEDLRADNETFDKIALDDDDQRGGPDNVSGCEMEIDGEKVPCRYPWVYMGPGIWIERPPDGAARPVHIRLAHTDNNIAGLADYGGAMDPRQLRLAISPDTMVTLEVRSSSHLHFHRLAIRYGGKNTVLLRDTTGIVFDHVRFFASTYGVATKGKNQGLRFQHCDFDGGKPSWFFRDDGKTEYTFEENDELVPNKLGMETMGSLLLPTWRDRGTTIEYCEFHRAHDLYLGGSDVDFHHNWIRDLNDDGLVLDAYGRKNVHIHENVILKTLSAINFGGAGKQNESPIAKAAQGPFHINRNLIDLREPIAGYRPKFLGDTNVWRYGNTFKSHGTDGRYAVFQNTFLVYGQAEDAAYSHFRNLKGNHSRRSFNNIFVAVSPDATSDKPITFIPSPSFPAQTDGNAYYRIGQATGPSYWHEAYEFQGKKYPGAVFFDCLSGCSRPLSKSTLVEQSKTQYAPGYEAHSFEGDPKFKRIGPDGIFGKDDDLRLCKESPVRGRGRPLPDDLRQRDGFSGTGPSAQPKQAPDIGCYRFNSDPLRVGVDGRRWYPAEP